MYDEMAFVPRANTVLASWLYRRPDGTVAYVEKIADGKGGWKLVSSTKNT